MTLTEVLANRGNVVAELSKSKSASANSTGGFDSLYKATDAPKSAEQRKADKPTAKVDNKLPAPKDKADAQQPVKAEERTEKPAEQTQTAEKPALWKNVEVRVDEQGNKKLVDLDALQKFAQDLALKLGVTVQAVIQALETLQLKPEDLAEPRNAAKFAQEIFGLSEPKELLSRENIKETLDIIMDAGKEALKKTIADFADEVAKAATTAEAAKPKEAAKPVETAATTVVADEGEAPEAKLTVTAAAVTKPEKPAPQAQTQSQTESGPQNGPKPQTQAQTFVEVNVAANQQSLQEIRQTFTINEATRNINTRDVIEQIVSRVRVEVKADTTEMRLTLKPENLGDVQLKISTQNGIVTAQFMAESQRVKEIIEAGFGGLKDALNRQGLNVESLNVSVGQEREDANEAGQSQAGVWNRAIAYGEGGDEAIAQAAAPQIDAYGQDLARGAVDYVA